MKPYNPRTYFISFFVHVNLMSFTFSLRAVILVIAVEIIYSAIHSNPWRTRCCVILCCVIILKKKTKKIIIKLDFFCGIFFNILFSFFTLSSTLIIFDTNHFTSRAFQTPHFPHFGSPTLPFSTLRTLYFLPTNTQFLSSDHLLLLLVLWDLWYW